MSMSIRRRMLGKTLLPSEFQQVPWIGQRSNTIHKLYVSFPLNVGDIIHVDCLNRVYSGTQQRCSLGLRNEFSVGQKFHGGDQIPWQCTLIGSTLTSDRDSAIIKMTRSVSGFYIGDYTDTHNSYTYYGDFFGVTVSRLGRLIAFFVPCYRKNGGQTGVYEIKSRRFYATSGGNWITGVAA